MSEALYRKYRPQTFEDVVGQTHIERTLKNAIEADKVSHAYLFCGPRGTGKTTTARLLAKALLCERGPTPSPDGECEQCLAIAEGTHPDVNELDAASRTGVENVREEIIGRVQYAPTRGRYKIYIIDEVHMLSPAAFNALLKTLEEPPSHVVFILCTTDPQKVLETVRSRCQRFDFHRLSNEEIVSRLGAVCVAEDVEFEGDALDLIAHRSQGGMRDALTTLEQLIAFGNGKVTLEVARDVLGELDADDMGDIVGHILCRDAAACFSWVADYIETGADLAQFTRDLAAYVRNLYVLALTGGAASVDVETAARERMTAEAQSFGADRLAYALRVLGDLSTELRQSANARLSFEIALTRMVRPESDFTLESLAARVAQLEAQLESGVVASRAHAGAQVVSAPPASASAASDAPHPAAYVPAASSGYKMPAPPVSAQPAEQPAAQAAAAMSKAAALRAQIEQRQKQMSPAAEQVQSKPRAPIAPSAQSPTSAAMPASAQVASMGSSANAQAMAANASANASVAAPSAAAATAPSSGVVSVSAPAAAPDSAVPASDAVKAKISNPASLQRGWQATLAELKRQRAVYAALMQSARVMANSAGDGIMVEFSRENEFAYSAAQKPDVAAALASALHFAFGAAVPFAFSQGSGAAAAIAANAPSLRATAEQAPVAPSRPAFTPPAPRPRPQAPAPVPAPASANSAFVPMAPAPATPASASMPSAPVDDDVVPYTDADVAAYEEDSAFQAPWDGAPAQMSASAAVQAPAPVPGTASAPAAAASQAQPKPQAQPAPQPVSEKPPAPESASSAEALAVDGPAPVDPYPIGKRLGFDSMPAPKKRPKGTVPAVGWPGVASVGKPAAEKAPASADEAPVRPARRQDTSAQDSASASALAPAEPLHSVPAQAQPAPNPQAIPQPPADKPNPFASRRMPEGIGQGGASAPVFEPARPAASAGAQEMGIEDIFGAFGVSMDGVQEEGR